MQVMAHLEDELTVSLDVGEHHLVADEPVAVGGNDRGPDPYGLLLASVAACKAITGRMYALRKQWPLESIKMAVSTKKVHARDCEDCESDPEARVDIIDVELELIGELTPDQRARIAEIIDRCPVHRTLTSETKIRTALKN